MRVVRVLAKVTGELALPGPTTVLVGWNFQALLRQSTITSPVKVTGSPTRTGADCEM